jgi:hypothetical protein
MSDDTLTPETPENVIPFTPAESTTTETPAAEQTGESAPKQPASLSELIQNIDITGISDHQIITDLVAGIQQLAMRGTIALGLLERIALRDSVADSETPAEETEAPAEDTETVVS